MNIDQKCYYASLEFEKNNEIDKAIFLLEQAIELKTENPDAYLKLYKLQNKKNINLIYESLKIKPTKNAYFEIFRQKEFAIKINRSNDKIKNFTIYGERCSGTNFLEAIFTGKSYFYDDKKNDGSVFFKEELPAFNIPVTWDFGHKHFFGFDDEKIKINGDNTLFIGIVRDPYDWLSSFFIKKHHVPQINHSLKNFLFGEWFSINHDEFSENFLKEYEEDRNLLNGKRYKNIFELRKNKLNYLFNTMPKIAKNYILIKYEDLCNNQKEIIELISEEFDLDICNYEYIKTKQFKKPQNKLKIQVIKNNLDWKVENLFGYSKEKNKIIPNKFDIEKIIPVNNDFLDSYTEKTKIGKEIAKTSKIVVVGLARNCDSQIENSINKIISLKTKKNDLFIYENDSVDLTKDILTSYAKNQETELLRNPEATTITVRCNDFNTVELKDKSLIRTSRLANYRNFCLNWVKENHENSDYVIVLDLDADLGFSIDGIYNSIYWLNNIENAGGMGSYSLILKHELFHYDSFAIRLNDWKKSNQNDFNNIWVKNFHPLIGSDPIKFYSCFGGLAIYKTKAFLSGWYDGEIGCEHVGFHKSLKDNNWDVYLNPSSRFFSVCEV